MATRTSCAWPHRACCGIKYRAAWWLARTRSAREHVAGEALWGFRTRYCKKNTQEVRSYLYWLSSEAKYKWQRHGNVHIQQSLWCSPPTSAVLAAGFGPLHSVQNQVGDGGGARRGIYCTGTREVILIPLDPPFGHHQITRFLVQQSVRKCRKQPFGSKTPYLNHSHVIGLGSDLVSSSTCKELPRVGTIDTIDTSSPEFSCPYAALRAAVWARPRLLATLEKWCSVRPAVLTAALGS